MMNTKTTSDDIIEHILSKLKSKHPDIHTKIFGSYDSTSNGSGGNDNAIKRRRATLISHGNEALRILDSKRVNLGKKENRTIRAALVIDYLVRNVKSRHTNNNNNNNNSKNASRMMYFRSSIPMTVLMSILGLNNTTNRKKDLENMQTLLGSYLENTVIAIKIASSGDGSNKQNTLRNLRKRSADGTITADVSKLNSDAIMDTTPTTTTTSSSLIRDLCINLGPLIPDAEFVFKYATKLFDALANNANVKKKSSRSSSSSCQREQDWLRQDMVRCLDCYEGACFYLAVKESEGANYNDVLKKKASAKITLKNQQKKEEVKKKNVDGGGGGRDDGLNNSNNHNNNIGDQDDGDDDEDDEDDTDDDRPMTEMDVVMAACLSERTFKTVLDYVKKYAQDIVISLDDTTTTDPKKPARKKMCGAKKDNRFGGRSVIVESHTNSGKKSMRRSSGSNTEFEQWKRKVLDATIAKMQTKNMSSREEALKCAAEEVVRDSQKTS